MNAERANEVFSDCGVLFDMSTAVKTPNTSGPLECQSLPWRKVHKDGKAFLWSRVNVNRVYSG